MKLLRLFRKTRMKDLTPEEQCIANALDLGNSSVVASADGKETIRLYDSFQNKNSTRYWLLGIGALGVVATADIYTNNYVFQIITKIKSSKIMPSVEAKTLQAANADTSKKNLSREEILANEAASKYGNKNQKSEIPQSKPSDYAFLKEFYEKNKGFVAETRQLFEVVYQGKFDLNNDGKLEDFVIYSGGDALVKFGNGLTRKLNTTEISSFFISSVMNIEEIKADFTTEDGKVLYIDSIPESHVLKLAKEYPGYISRLRNLGIATKIYTVQTKPIFEPKLTRLENFLK